MKILITGATGFVGKHLLDKLITSGYDDIRIITRNKNKLESSQQYPVEVFYWNPDLLEIEENALDGVDCVIHLAGESVADGRWTESKKNRILTSRINGTKTLLNAIDKSNTKPSKFISASAVGIYGNRKDEALDSGSSLGDGFLANVCKSWEDLCLGHDIDNMRSVCIRLGIVLGPNGGALSKMLPAFKNGLGGTLGSGKQYMSWIHIDDLVSQFLHLIKNDNLKPIYNGVTPNAVTNKEFTAQLGKSLNRPTLLPAPGSVLKLALGEMSQILTEGQRVEPTNFVKENFNFQYPGISNAFSEIFKYSKHDELVFTSYQWVPQNREKVFAFFSNEKNLEELTPSSLNFKVLRKSTAQIEDGTFIDYRLKFYSIPLSWQSQILSFTSPSRFIDEQVKGPYSKWHHTHEFFPYREGTLMKDTVVYKIPFGKIGKIVSEYFVKNEVSKIFSYRKKQIQKIFN